jgi:hypothetical protein
MNVWILRHIDIYEKIFKYLKPSDQDSYCEAFGLPYSFKLLKNYNKDIQNSWHEVDGIEHGYSIQRFGHKEYYILMYKDGILHGIGESYYKGETRVIIYENGKRKYSLQDKIEIVLFIIIIFSVIFMVIMNF